MRIAITGPESTGKSTLTRELAKTYNSEWVEEFAREYLNNTQGIYCQDDLLHIAKQQFKLNSMTFASKEKPLFCDTEISVIKIWSLVKYGNCHKEIIDLQQLQQFDFYFLCDIDTVWEYDPLREHPEMREELFEMYLNEMKTMNFPFEVVSGSLADRLEKCKSILKENFNLG